MDAASPSAVYWFVAVVSRFTPTVTASIRRKNFPGSMVCGVSVTCACKGSDTPTASQASADRSLFIVRKESSEAAAFFQPNLISQHEPNEPNGRQSQREPF